MAIEKVYPQLRCSACGGELESTEPETEYVFVLSVKPCKRCAAQQNAHPTKGILAASQALSTPQTLFNLEGLS